MVFDLYNLPLLVRCTSYSFHSRLSTRLSFLNLSLFLSSRSIVHRPLLSFFILFQSHLYVLLLFTLPMRLQLPFSKARIRSASYRPALSSSAHSLSLSSALPFPATHAPLK